MQSIEEHGVKVVLEHNRSGTYDRGRSLFRVLRGVCPEDQFGLKECTLRVPLQEIASVFLAFPLTRDWRADSE